MSLQLGLFPDADPSTHAAPVGPAPTHERIRRLADALPPGLRLGRSSWSFPGWAGIVYDRAVSERTLAKAGLSAYARHPLLRSFGIDRTYYRPVSEEIF